MSNVLKLTNKSKELFFNTLRIPSTCVTNAILTFEKGLGINVHLSFLPKVIETLICDYLVKTYSCSIQIPSDKKYIRCQVLNTNIFFEIYTYHYSKRNIESDVHCASDIKHNMSKIIQFHASQGIFILETLNDYMSKYYGVHDYFREYVPRPLCGKSKIEKVLDHKSLRLAIVIMKIMIRLLKKLKL